MTAYDAAALIDVSAVRTHNTISDIEECVNYAKKYRFINVHSLPCFTKFVAGLLANEEDIFVGAPVGFPSGGHATQTKLLEAKQLIEDGVDEMDIVMNVGKFRSGEYGYVLNELKEIIDITPEKVLIKVIIELNCLGDDEIEQACGIVAASGADFLKTGTGWIPGAVNIGRIRKIKEILRGRVKVKAAGGIRTREEFDALLALGVERFGINTKSAVEIVESFSLTADEG